MACICLERQTCLLKILGELVCKGHRRNPTDGTPPLQGQVERAGAVQSGDGKFWGDQIVDFQFIKELLERRGQTL